MPTSFEHQLDTLLERFSFNFTKYEINKVLHVTSLSKAAYKQEILSVVDGNEELINKIKELGLLALQLDTRQVEVFRVTGDDKDALDAFFSSVQVTTETSINDAFPFPIEDRAQLNRLSTGIIYPIKSDAVSVGTSEYRRLIACSMVDKEIEEPVPASHLSQTGQRLLGNDTVFTMKRKVRTQLFHVIYWCSESSRLIISVDRNGLSIAASQDQLFMLRQFLMQHGVDYGQATNVFGAIEPLYNAVDGSVTNLGHVTTDGNPVRIPLKGRQECLKKDHYHQAGEGGGYVHAKFMVAKKWKFPVDDTGRIVEVEVALSGQPKMLDTAQPLSDFAVNKVRRLEDFSFAIDKVLSHVPTH
ncbi:hypothetical protein HCG99_11585 [Enterobacter ludwigii]|uniref:hypothetical protein n=1 Tax=Enterobacter ludwigii TaxID=299767 RepID=UPI001C8BD41B|nr:hypothetical protein [Enterobacter ludwigii]MBX9044222.1 hypothetical protein [Enterobacter ludwigii]MBX9081472.1 hypothetical protein [Enterobacter ludwigii]